MNEIAKPAFLNSDYKLVWHDEFDGNEINPDKWSFNSAMSAKSVLNTENKENARIENGKLVLENHRIDDSGSKCRYSTATSLTTYDTMNYRFGYVEMSAKIPFSYGGPWPSFWTKSIGGIRSRINKDYMVEVDIFEVFSSPNHLAYTLHKWYDGEGTKHWMGVTDGYDVKNPQKINEEFHKYGFLWTESEMSFYFDGKKAASHGITDKNNFDPDDRHTDMSGFRNDCLFLLINNMMFTDNTSWAPYEKAFVNEDTVFPIRYEAEYVRLWQQNGIGELHIKESARNVKL